MSKTPISASQPVMETDENIVGHVIVEPGKKSSFVVGIFEEGIPEPNLKLEIEPENSAVNSQLERARAKGDYRLTYHFSALQNIPCKITVREQVAW